MNEGGMTIVIKGLGCWAVGMYGRIAGLIALGVLELRIFQNHNHDDAWERDAPGSCERKAGDRGAMQGRCIVVSAPGEISLRCESFLSTLQMARKSENMARLHPPTTSQLSWPETQKQQFKPLNQLYSIKFISIDEQIRLWLLGTVLDVWAMR